MRRGFKKEARETAAEIRGELGLTLTDPLDPWALAEHLAIPVWSLSSFADSIPEAVQHLSREETGAVSGVLAYWGLARVILHNDGHTLPRQRADIAHELAHALLLHPPHLAVDGQAPHYDRTQEDEAKWLGGVLLVSDESCLACCRDETDVVEAAVELGVSQQLMQWRLNMSGAKRRVARARGR